MRRPDRERFATRCSEALGSLAELVGFTLGALLFVGATVLLLAVTLRVTGQVTDSTTVQSTLAIVVFTTSVAGGVYLLVRRER